jgi:DNA-binding XRE family transcriptional regulator
MTALLNRAEGRVRRRFLRLVRDSGELASLQETARLLEAGRIQEALALAQDIAPGISSTLEQVYLAAGLSSAEVLRSQVDTLFDFNLANSRAVNDLRLTRLRLVREFAREQALATTEMLADAFARGLSPIEQARELKRSIGLTRNQAQIVRNYRRNLERNSSQALGRALRDRRFDPSVRRAIRTGQPLSTAQIDRMVARYQQRWVQFRAQTIAVTESRRAASAADAEFWTQAVEDGVVPADAIDSIWRISPPNVRASHQAMRGQRRPFGEPFTSGDGNALRYPSDPLAPASDTVNCKCVIERKVRKAAMVAFNPSTAQRRAA